MPRPRFNKLAPEKRERIMEAAAKEFAVGWSVVLSGTGAKDYYRAESGYTSLGNYMVKQLATR